MYAMWVQKDDFDVEVGSRCWQLVTTSLSWLDAEDQCRFSFYLHSVHKGLANGQWAS